MRFSALEALQSPWMMNSGIKLLKQLEMPKEELKRYLVI